MLLQRQKGQLPPRGARAAAALVAAATLGPLAAIGCGPAPASSNAKPGTCAYSEFEGTCQLVSIDDFTPPKSPGDLRARYVTRGAAPGGKPETLVLRYQVEPRVHHRAMIHLQSNPIVKCGVSHLVSGRDCKPTVTTLRVPELPGGLARGELSLEPQ